MWNCRSCGQFYEIQDWHPNLKFVCEDCLDFDINLGVMDWRLLQMQRATLLALSTDDRLDEKEQEHIEGILSLTDHIIDTATSRGKKVPSLDEIVLDRLADA